MNNAFLNGREERWNLLGKWVIMRQTNDVLDIVPQQVIDIFFDGFVTVVNEPDLQPIAGLNGQLFDLVHDIVVQTAALAVYDYPDNILPIIGQALCQQIWPIAKLFCGLPNPNNVFFAHFRSFTPAPQANALENSRTGILRRLGLLPIT